jgi:hypothetical protein
MKLFRKIDTTTGNFLEDVLFESHPTLEDGELDTQYIEDAPTQGLYWPRWNGTEWVEGGVAPEPQPHELAIEELLMMAIADLDAQREADKLEQQLAMAELAETMMGGTL